MNTRLRPCPFCGGEDLSCGHYGNSHYYWIECKCGARMEEFYRGGYTAAIKKWNRRIDDAGNYRAI